MLIETLSAALRRARTVNQTSNGYVSKIITATEPVGDAGTATGASVIELGPGACQNAALLLPYAVGANNNTFSVRVIGWRSAGTAGAKVWVPVPLCELACTVSSSCVGVTSGEVIATELFADTIAITKEPTRTADVTAAGTLTVYSPANNTHGFALVPLYGFQKLELSFTTGGSATSCNALLALL